jgi:hydroxymethylpyrimidine kinase/phosphomethylpyrimidine kinase
MRQVMVSTSGSHLLPESAISTLIERLLPLTTVLTPNLPEAELLLKIAGAEFETPQNVDDIIKMAQRIQQLGPQYVLLKGGHLPFTKGRQVSRGDGDKDIVLNVLVSSDGVIIMESEFLRSNNTHGTGCSLACKFLGQSLQRSVVLTFNSRYRMQPRVWYVHDESGRQSKSLRRGRYQNQRCPRQRQWAD